MKKCLAIILTGIMLLTTAFATAPIAFADPEVSSPEPGIIEDEYTGIASAQAILFFSGGNVVYGCRIAPQSNYSFTVTIKLKKDGSVIKTWFRSAAIGQYLAFQKTYGAVSGSTYQVVLSINVYDSTGNLVSTILLNSPTNTCP
jgi:hypothetical protein